MTLSPSLLPEHVVLDDFAVEATGLLVAELWAAVRARGLVSVALAGGGTPLGLYRGLAIMAGDVDWKRVHVFWGDERLVSPDDSGSNYREAFEALLSHVPIPPENIHRVRGELPAGEAVADYVAQLRDWAAVHDPRAPNPWPRFDIVLLGLGEDGHTASLFPGSPVDVAAPVIAVTADYQGRPAGRVTLTPRLLNDARRVIFLATGPKKTAAVRETWTIDDPVRFPARRICPANGRVTWWLDRAAAGDLTSPA